MIYSSHQSLMLYDYIPMSAIRTKENFIEFKDYFLLLIYSLIHFELRKKINLFDNIFLKIALTNNLLKLSTNQFSIGLNSAVHIILTVPNYLITSVLPDRQVNTLTLKKIQFDYQKIKLFNLIKHNIIPERSTQVVSQSLTILNNTLLKLPFIIFLFNLNEHLTKMKYQINGKYFFMRNSDFQAVTFPYISNKYIIRSGMNNKLKNTYNGTTGLT